MQFHGCFFHGCIKCFRINRAAKLSSGRSMEEKWEETLATSAQIEKNGYELVQIWECEFDAEVRENEELRTFLDEECNSILRIKPLNPRDAFFGGRTGNNIKIYDCKDSERIRYVDVCSLYPFVNKNGVYPIGHPKVLVGERECKQLVGDDFQLCRVNGLIMCDVLPPQQLHHGVLPVKMHDKLLFPLCRMCCEEMLQEDCPHSNPDDRELRGTWVSLELIKAVELGYTVRRIHEIWHYETTSQFNRETRTGGLFAAYINKFFGRKILASGFPPDCTTETEKDAYIELIKRCEGIDVDKSKMEFNAGARSISKLCLNSLWGRYFFSLKFFSLKV